MVQYAPVIQLNRQIKSSLLLLLATVIWGSAFVSQSIAANYIGPFTFQASRGFMAVICMIPVIILFDRTQRDGRSFWKKWSSLKLWKAGILCGVLLFLACNLQQMGLADTDPGKSGFLTAMYIVMVPIIGIFRRKKPGVLVPISVLLAVGGLYCLSCVGVTSIQVGDLLLLGCALAFSVQITVVDIYVTSVDPLRLNTLQVLVCTILSAIFMSFTESPSWSGIASSFLPLVHTGVLSMGLAYGLQIIAQKDLPPAPAALIMSLESVFALLFGVIFLQEEIDLWKAVGCILIFVAVILSQIPTGRRNA